MPTLRPVTNPQLIYLVYGANTYHQEAVFSIASALAGQHGKTVEQQESSTP
jgi:hypothetical protein